MNTKEWKLTEDMVLGIFDGGPGSGNFGHAGRPGEVGGSAKHAGHKAHSWAGKGRPVKPKYYAKVAQDLGVSREEAKVLADTVNDYTRHSTEFRSWSRDPEGYAAEHGKDAAAVQAAKVKPLEDFISKSPKWSGGKLFRGTEVDAADYEDFLAAMKAKGPVNLGGPSSWSSDKKIADLFAGYSKGIDINGDRMSVVFVTNKSESDFGTSIAHLSGAPINEREVLVTGKAQFRPSGKITDLGPAVYIYGDIEEKK